MSVLAAVALPQESGQKLPPGQSELYQRSDEILWIDRDSIGVSGIPEARNEYYSYLPIVFRLALEGSSENEIAKYLYCVETKYMGLPGNKQKCRKIAGMVLGEKTNRGL